MRIIRREQILNLCLRFRPKALALKHENRVSCNPDLSQVWFAIKCELRFEQADTV